MGPMIPKELKIYIYNLHYGEARDTYQHLPWSTVDSHYLELAYLE